MRGLAGIVLARLAVNGGIRVVYPFLAVIAHGLGLSLEVVALLIASRALAGLAGPAVVRLVPPCRRRTLMLASQLLLVAGCVLIIGSHAAPTPVRTALVGLGFVATGLARPLFDLPMQTWVSAHVPAAARGRAFGLTELSWALSLGITVPAAGVLIGLAGWRSPFMLIVGMAAAGAVALVLAVPRDRPDHPPSHEAPGPVAARQPSHAPTTRAPVAVCVAAGLAVAAAQSLLVVHGVWLASDFGMSVAHIGASTLVIVIAELAAEGLVITMADRLGLVRTLRHALAVSVAAYAALGVVGHRDAAALVALGLLFVAFEVTFITLIAFVSTTADVASDAGRVLGSLMAAIAVGNAVGAAIGPVLFSLGGIGLSGAVSALAAMAALALLARGRVLYPVLVRRRRRRVGGVGTGSFDRVSATTMGPSAIRTSAFSVQCGTYQTTVTSDAGEQRGWLSCAGASAATLDIRAPSNHGDQANAQCNTNLRAVRGRDVDRRRCVRRSNSSAPGSRTHYDRARSPPPSSAAVTRSPAHLIRSDETR